MYDAEMCVAVDRFAVPALMRLAERRLALALWSDWAVMLKHKMDIIGHICGAVTPANESGRSLRSALVTLLLHNVDAIVSTPVLAARLEHMPALAVDLIRQLRVDQKPSGFLGGYTCRKCQGLFQTTFPPDSGARCMLCGHVWHSVTEMTQLGD
jgi:hypothetical protein